MENKNRDFKIEISAEGKNLSQTQDGVISGELKVDQIDLELTISSEERGIALAYFYIEIEDGPPISF